MPEVAMGTLHAGPSTLTKVERAQGGETMAERESPDAHPGTMASDNNVKRKEREEDGAGDPSSESRQRKHKFTRSRTACYQCRSRKSKCGAQPPDPCGNCIEAGLQCQWPEQDGRSSRARMARKARMSGSGPVGAAGSGTSNVDWLDALLRTSTPRSPDKNAAAYPVNGMDRMPLMGSMPTVPSTGPAVQTVAPSAIPLPTEVQPPPQPYQGVGFDPNQFIWAVSSRLPIVEDGSPLDHPSHGSRSQSSYVNDTSPRAQERERNEDSKMVKVTWWRPHGSTAIAPGLKRITLKVRVDKPSDTWRLTSPRTSIAGPGQESLPLIGPDGAPNPPIMKHLLDVFLTHFGCQYPFINRADLEAKIDSQTGSVFLLNSIAAIAARFSTHPAIALPDVKVYDYGNVFYARAKTLLGSMLAVPSRETVTAFVLLASCGFSNDSESEVWMMTGLAVRMSIDLGLHLDPPATSSITPEDRRLNRLVFWSVVLMDYALAFGVGRSTTFRSEEITQPVPTQEDVYPGWTQDSGIPRSPFPYCAKMMFSYGPLINMLNRSDYSKLEGVISEARGAAINEYNRLPQDMHWHVTNLQTQSRANQASAFLHLHLWLHTILASEFLTGSNLLRRPGLKVEKDIPSGIATPRTITTSNLWRNSARTIGDILVLSDIICPLAYCALPFVNQAFFVAGCCYVKEIEASQAVGNHAQGSSVPPQLQALGQPSVEHEPVPPTPGMAGLPDDASGRSSINISRALLASVASTNISTLQQGLDRQHVYWEGTAWISSALKQRVEGMGEVDLVRVTEKLGSFVRLPDAGLVGQKPVAGSDDDATMVGGVNGHGNGNGTGLELEGRQMLRPMMDNGLMVDWFAGTPADHNNADFMSSLPFDIATTDSGQHVVEQDVSIPTTFDSQWFS